MNVLGIDPGLKGGAALVKFGNDWVDLVNAWPLPVIKGGASGPLGTRATIDVKRLGALLPFLDCDHAVVERQEYRPGNASGSSFTTAFNYGLIAAEVMRRVAARQIFWVQPQVWKRDLGLSSNKERSRKLASEIFGAAAGVKYWPRKKDEGISEGALLAVWRGRRLMEMLGQKGQKKTVDF